MTTAFRNHAVRELAWAFEGPGLLSEESFPGKIEGDAYMRELIARHRPSLDALESDPTPLLDFLSSIEIYDRLGRYFEALLRFFLVELEKVDRLQGNLQIRQNRTTLGELDLVFKRQAEPLPRHWEASVKFYLCTALDDDEAREERFFMGTLVEDRMDRKLEKLIDKQLRLPESEPGKLRLEELGLSHPQSRALLKGFLYYPSHRDWKHHAHPGSVSPSHVHGWWTTSGVKHLPRSGPESRYILLDPARWLAPFYGFVPAESVMTERQLVDLVEDVFSGPVSERALMRELMIAEVFPEEEKHSHLLVRERSRGNILHADWPLLAREAAQTPKN